jgi:hypothetical protein
MKRVIITVQPIKGGSGWEILTPDGPYRPGVSKRLTIAQARELARASMPSQLRIKGRNGRVQTEHTYPRASDPRRYKG